MRIISRSKLKTFYEHEAFRDSEKCLRAWYAEAVKAHWKNPAQIKVQYHSSSILKDGRVVFNICGNKYRLIVKINFDWSVVYIRFIGTHKQYDSIDAESI